MLERHSPSCTSAHSLVEPSQSCSQAPGESEQGAVLNLDELLWARIRGHCRREFGEVGDQRLESGRLARQRDRQRGLGAVPGSKGRRNRGVLRKKNEDSESTPRSRSDADSACSWKKQRCLMGLLGSAEAAPGEGRLSESYPQPMPTLPLRSSQWGRYGACAIGSLRTTSVGVAPACEDKGSKDTATS